jgi:integrase
LCFFAIAVLLDGNAILRVGPLHWGWINLHFHGLRHTTATALAEAGASSHEIMAITGHQTEQMVKHYTKGVEQKKLAPSAIRKLERGGGEA